MTSTVACPECSQAATVIDRFSLNSTDGPVERLRIRCVGRHHFTMAADGIAEYAPPADLQADLPAAS